MVSQSNNANRMLILFLSVKNDEEAKAQIKQEYDARMKTRESCIRIGSRVIIKTSVLDKAYQIVIYYINHFLFGDK